MDFSAMTTEQLLAELAKADADRTAAKERGRAVKAALVARQQAEQAVYFGLTPELYAEAKRVAAAGGEPLASVLSRARKANAIQVAKALAASVGAAAKGV